MRRCIGSVKFGIEAHEAPITDFPAQPSQRDGLGRMCRTHWSAYTAGLARDAKARTAAAEASTVTDHVEIDRAESGAPEESKPTRQRTRRVAIPEAGAQGAAG